MRDTVTIIPNFITTEECKILNSWVQKAIELKWLDCGVTTNRVEYPGRLTTRMYGDRFDRYDDLAYTIHNRIRAALGIPDLPVSLSGGGKHGIVVSNTLPGGDVYLHSDPKEGSIEVLRCNIITQAAELGAVLTVADTQYDVMCGDLHCYLASKYPHAVSTVTGNCSRVLWMFGFQISDKDWEK